MFTSDSENRITLSQALCTLLIILTFNNCVIFPNDIRTMKMVQVSLTNLFTGIFVFRTHVVIGIGVYFHRIILFRTVKYLQFEEHCWI